MTEDAQQQQQQQKQQSRHDMTMQLCLPDPAQQSSLMARKRKSIAESERIRIEQHAIEREEDMKRSVRSHMEWCTMAITDAMEAGSSHCLFHVKPTMNYVTFYNPEEVMQRVMTHIQQTPLYHVERIDKPLTILIRWPTSSSSPSSSPSSPAPSLSLDDTTQTTISKPKALLLDSNATQRIKMPSLAASCMDLMSTFSKLAEIERKRRS